MISKPAKICFGLAIVSALGLAVAQGWVELSHPEQTRAALFLSYWKLYLAFFIAALLFAALGWQFEDR